MNIETNWEKIHNWQQPIIEQSEIGILGIITKKLNQKIYYLMQAKIEPGNINCVQISPTLQATKSNYLQVHNGKKPKYLSYFLMIEKNSLLTNYNRNRVEGFIKNAIEI